MKKDYIQPIVEQAQLMPSSIVLAGSPTGGGQQGINTNSDPIPSGNGGD